MGLFRRLASVGAMVCFANAAAAAPLYTFTDADEALPAYTGDGLFGEIWTGIDVDTLAAARSYIGGTPADATFLSTGVDYPAGAAGSLSTSSTFATALGSDAASLSDPTVGTETVLNSILRFSGYLRVDAPGSLFLGLGSDDGSELIIQGTQVIANDGIHAFPGGGAGPVEVGFLEAGLFQIEVLFFESQISEWGVEFFEGSAAAGTAVAGSQLYSGLTPPPVPLPATFPLLGAALAGALMFGRCARKREH